MARWKNINGTSDRQCNCGSWLKHWENATGRTAFYCSVYGCSNFAEVGAHVHDTYGLIAGHRIVPMCRACNNRSDAFDLSAGVETVSANVSQTCGKK